MQTRKLYYEDCQLNRFSARVTGCRETEDGWLIALDATAFYPGGGGQSCDTGTLGGLRVLAVQEEDEAILHLCDGPLALGAEVTGEVDFARRFDFMQQHTGEHIVSGLIHKYFGWHNTGFHMGAECMTVDFDGPVPPEALKQIELEANEAVWKNLPLTCRTPGKDELPNIFYRTKKALEWPVRLVQIPGYDSCACCGIHVAATGQVGLIKIFSCVKFHQGIRLEMACGRMALAYMTAAFEENRQVSQAFSAKILETGEAARRMNEALAAEKYRSTGLQMQLFDRIARDYVNQENVVLFDPSLTGSSLRELTDRIAGYCRGFAALFSGSDETGYTYCLISRQEDLRPLGKQLTQQLSGRGGGRADCQQGSVRAPEAAIRCFFDSLTAAETGLSLDRRQTE